ncbi:hypothetical protein P1P75_00920 [Streptomyces sp. ID05-39B]|uniref:hypothetical protein n=1 Tax=Streptomyces sp. ID05-39B TaxID=3028664 RepID=UPI0029B1329A|nr:hypothetical protein [Streptomyces sp. ID05-39B]MDX3525050.1 hypothetical protein [Streptomyces sp. ID05-39B]
MADETTEQAQKKTPRKPDPMTQLLNELKVQIKAVENWDVKGIPAGRIEQYDRRASAWGRHYGQNGTLDGLILSLAFEALACYPQERRYSLVQLAAAALLAAEKLEPGK